MEEFYLHIKVFHVLGIVTWMAGIFYLPRLFVYHAENLSRYELCAVFKVMERRLYRAIMLPSIIVVWFSGLSLVYVIGIYGYWLFIKLFCVVCLTIFHFYLGHLVGLFQRDKCSYSARFFRILNEVPTVLLILIVFMVIVKPI